MEGKKTTLRTGKKSLDKGWTQSLKESKVGNEGQTFATLNGGNKKPGLVKHQQLQEDQRYTRARYRGAKNWGFFGSHRKTKSRLKNRQLPQKKSRKYEWDRRCKVKGAEETEEQMGRFNRQGEGKKQKEPKPGKKNR